MEFSVAEVMAGLDRNEFYIEYMPIVSLASGSCVAAEALVRWKKGDEVVSPLKFIPAFEEGPLIGLVTYWLIEKIGAELGDWMRQNPTFHISINVPPELFGRGGLLYAAKQAHLADLYPQLVLELTERGVPDKISLEGMRFAQRMGLGIAIDDIEGGNLNLLLLARSQVDYIKLDKSVVDTIDEHGFQGPISQEVAQVVTLGSPLLVAEGIETELQLTSLRKMGVQLGQGWLISKALGRDEFLVFYENCHKKQN